MGRLLIVNADDFGLSEGVNRGILRAHREGIVTSASLMVRSRAAGEAVQSAASLDLGLHVDLGEWTYRDGAWLPLYERVSLDDPDAVEAEVHRQLEEFMRLTGHQPSHIDSHQHVHLREPARSILRQIANDLSVPLRSDSPRIRYCGEFYGQSAKGRPRPEAIRTAALKELLRRLPEGVTELGCHPGDDETLAAMYCRERIQETDVLCDPSLRETLAEEQICLCTFAEAMDLVNDSRPGGRAKG